MTVASDGADSGAVRDEGGDPACWLNRVCPTCGRLSTDPRAGTCAECGADLPE